MRILIARQILGMFVYEHISLTLFSEKMAPMSKNPMIPNIIKLYFPHRFSLFFELYEGIDERKVAYSDSL